VLPKNDAFWSHNQPGNLWGCKCDWEETDEPATMESPERDKVIHSKGLDGNPGQTGEVFSREASYFKAAEKVAGAEKECHKAMRNDVSRWAHENLQGTTLKHAAIDDEICFSSNGIREYLNRPMDDYLLKNELLRSVKSILPEATYMGFSTYKSNDNMPGAYIFEFKINDKKRWYVVRKYTNGDTIFYSISDNETILEGIKK
jgi:hypothetical protein